jgi:hypothetical protein
MALDEMALNPSAASRDLHVMGWPAVITLLLMLLAVTVGLVRIAARTWFEYLLVAAFAAVFVRPALRFITGDVSRWLPGWIWSDGADGKDQIVDVGALATLLLPVIGGCLLVILIKLLRRRTAEEVDNPPDLTQ